MNLETIGHHGLFFLTVWPIAAAFISFLIGRRSKSGRDYFAISAVVIEFLVMFGIVFAARNDHPPSFEFIGFMGYKIHLTLDGFRAIYGLITAFMWMMTTIFSREYFAHYRNRNRYYFFLLMTLSGTIGTFLSADLVTTFLFFEIMSFTSYVMVLHDERRLALEASRTYMAVAVIGGLSMIFGIFLVNAELGTTEIGAFYEAMKHFEGNKARLYMAAAFMLVGFGGKAGMYPLHIWLPNAHPVAPAPASALLSGVLTKTGIFGILIVSALLFNGDFNWGLIMLSIGVLGMFTGALLALFSIDLKRTLACSSVSQIGFILVGVGMMGILNNGETYKYTSMATMGTMLHMINHSLIKLVLFLMAGVVYVNLHQLDLNQVRGFGRGKPLFTFCFLMGVMAIIGIPFWNGYVSKTLLHESIVERIWYYYDYIPMAHFFRIVESIFTLTGGLTTAYMIKIFTCVCIEKNQFHQEKLSALNKKYISKASAGVLLVAAIILPILGFSPYKFMIPIAQFGEVFMKGKGLAHPVEFFVWANVKGAVASLSIGVIIYFLIVRGSLMAKDAQKRSIYVNLWPSFIDIEKKVYRPLLLRLLPFVGALVARIYASLTTVVSSLGYKAFMAFRNFWIAKMSNFKPEFANVKVNYAASVEEIPDFRVGLDYMKGACDKMLETAPTAGYGLGLVQQGHEKLWEKAPEDYGLAAAWKTYDKVVEKTTVPDFGLSFSQKASENIFGKISGFFNKGVDDRFEMPKKPLINSLAYCLLLFLIGAIVVVAVVL